jgi:hypothetical protein
MVRYSRRRPGLDGRDLTLLKRIQFFFGAIGHICKDKKSFKFIVTSVRDITNVIMAKPLILTNIL